MKELSSILTTSKSWRTRIWLFNKEMRKAYFADDKYEAVHDVLGREGWTRVFDPTLPCDLMWTNLKSIAFESRKFKSVNHFPGSQSFSNKVF